MNTSEAINAMLNNLDTWRHFPKYQMERRADLFFSLFLREIIQDSKFTDSKTLRKEILPEFPFKNVESLHTTVNFDYVLFSEDLQTAFIVELKTDSNSAGDLNNPYLAGLSENNVTFTDIMNGLLQVAKKSRHKMKYYCLLKELENIGIIESLGADGWQCKHHIAKPVIIHLAPGLTKSESAKINLIDFYQAATTLEKLGGEVERQFASYLRHWQNTKAGHRD
jgi:hypothetical protein